MKSLLILLTAVMAVSANTASVTSNTKQVKDLVDKASLYLEEARDLGYKLIAYYERDNSATLDHLWAAKNALDNLNEASNAIKKFNANLSIRGTDSPVTPVTQVTKVTQVTPVTKAK